MVLHGIEWHGMEQWYSIVWCEFGCYCTAFNSMALNGMVWYNGIVLYGVDSDGIAWHLIV